MISIIVSSYNKKYFQSFSKSVKETIGDGVSYEIIDIWNPGKIGICYAYNQGANQAKYDNLLFIHEDTLFITKDWGNRLLNLLYDKNIGVVGVAGSSYVPNVPAFWWGLNEICFYNLVQSDQKDEKIIIYKLDKKYGGKKKVYSLDGVFLACRKKVYLEFQFNNNLKGFHGYDIDFSLRVASKYINIVTGEILIKHFSYGNLSQDWFTEIINIRNNYIIPKDQINNKEYEIKKYFVFIDYLSKYKYPFFWSLNKQIKYLSVQKLGIKGFLKVNIKILKYIKFFILKKLKSCK
ncbi:glycosyltransferase [uncultured Apibacter sp.]|uniref:glycosyltransferase n=1 Tax=uncultured Apibacter sp. TaxID=1778616 RepID=UPI0025E00825|nr:glycosyltransferase [uncultured Apibacter sp.]